VVLFFTTPLSASLIDGTEHHTHVGGRIRSKDLSTGSNPRTTWGWKPKAVDLRAFSTLNSYDKIRRPSSRKMPLNIISSACGLLALSKASFSVILRSFTRS